MENITKIKNSLLIIALNLYKHLLLDDKEYKILTHEISESDESSLYRLACKFLKIALNNNVYKILKVEFEKIKETMNINLYHEDIAKLKFYIKKRMINCNIPVFFDGCFDSDFLVDKVKIYVPIYKRDAVMFELYSMRADLYENNGNLKNIHSEALALFNDLLEVEVYFYDITKEGNLKFKKYYSNDEKTELLEAEIEVASSNIPLFFKDYDNGCKIETSEFMFMNAIDGETASDFIKTMNLKSSINLKKVNNLRLKINYNIQREDKNNGLQKIS